MEKHALKSVLLHSFRALPVRVCGDQSSGVRGSHPEEQDCGFLQRCFVISLVVGYFVCFGLKVPCWLEIKPESWAVWDEAVHSSQAGLPHMVENAGNSTVSFFE